MSVDIFIDLTNASTRRLTKNASLRSIFNRYQKFLGKPWLNAGIRKSIRARNNFFNTTDWDKDKFHCSQPKTGHLKNLCMPDLPNLSEKKHHKNRETICNMAFAVSTVLSIQYLTL